MLLNEYCCIEYTDTKCTVQCILWLYIEIDAIIHKYRNVERLVSRNLSPTVEDQQKL